MRPCYLRTSVSAAGPDRAAAAARTALPPPQPPPVIRAPPVPAQPPRDNQFSPNELIDAGHHFFGGVSRGLATDRREGGEPMGPAERLHSWARKPAALLSAACAMATARSTPRMPATCGCYWQGPTLGFDAGADGARTMMLVYNLPRTEAIFDRFGGIDGSAYFVGGFGMTALTANDIVVVPIRSGVGLRLGANLGYLKFTPGRPGIRSDRQLPTSHAAQARHCRLLLRGAAAVGLG